MIIFEIRTATNLVEKTIQGDTFCIGSAPSCDLTPHDLLLESELELIHIKVTCNEDQYTITNEANDPLVLLNGLSFGKRTLLIGDQLKIHNTLISIKYLKSAVKEKMENFDESFDEMELLEQVDSLYVKEKPIQKQKEEREEKFKHVEMQDSQEEEIRDKSSMKGDSSFMRSNAFYLPLLFILVGLGVTFFFSLYLTGKEERKEQQAQAARSVADTSMALLYAHLYDLKPNHDNWASSDFLKGSLNHILPAKYAYYPINDFGELQHCRYMMRIYTDKHLKRFILIAQPISELLSWVRSRESIFLDSQDMQLKLLSEIKPINRLLQTNSLEKLDPDDLAEAIKNAKVIHLSELGSEYTPPRELSFIQAGAENVVYNAPRYYRLTEKILDEAMIFSKKVEEVRGKQEIFRRNYERLLKLPSLVFYTSQGIKGAMLAYQALVELGVSHELVGYLTLKTENKMQASSHLLLIKPEFTIRSGKENLGGIYPQEETHKTIWLSLMKNLSNARYQLLKPISEQMMLLLHQHSQSAIDSFNEKFQKLLSEYYRIDREERKKIPRALEQIYGIFLQEEPHLSPKVFLSNLQIVGLESFLDENVQKQILHAISEYHEE